MDMTCSFPTREEAQEFVDKITASGAERGGMFVISEVVSPIRKAQYTDRFEFDVIAERDPEFEPTAC